MTFVSFESCKSMSGEGKTKSPGEASAHAQAVAKDTGKGDSKLELTSSGASNQVKLGFEGCRNDGSIDLPIVNPINDGYICPDVFPDPPHQATYTSGELGKGWNELDLVPHRLTTGIGKNGVDETFQVAIAADRVTNGGFNGYDIIEAPVLNTDKSDASCQAPVVSAQTITGGLQGGASS
jgi:hypothetical protein